MTRLVENTSIFKEILATLGKSKDASIKTVIVKLDRGKEMIDAGDVCYIKRDKRGKNESPTV